MTDIKIIHTSEINAAGAHLDGQLWYESISAGLSVKDYSRQLYNELGLKYSKFHKMDDFCRLGFLTAESLLRIVDMPSSLDRVGIFLWNEFSSIQTDEAFFKSYGLDNQGIPSPSLFVYTLPNILIGEISIRHKITGEHSFFVQPSFEVDSIYLYVQSLFDAGMLDAAIIGYCEVTPWDFTAKMGWLTQGTGELIHDEMGFNTWITKTP